MDNSLQKIKDILKLNIGLDASTLGDATIHTILNQRMHKTNIENIDDYYFFLKENTAELKALLEISTIPETWFFRDTKPFTTMLKKIQEKHLSSPDYHFSILCIPCSTGEEPYTIAMYLLNSGISKDAFKIQAVDINHQAIDSAKQGIYGNNSFRNDTAENYKSLYFKAINNSFIIDDSLRKNIEFSQSNILSQNKCSFKQKFDFIFCRNLLIYFDVETKTKSFSNLHQLLNDDGYLFIGHSEFGAVPNDIFSILESEKSFALVKKHHADNKKLKHDGKLSSIKKPNLTPARLKTLSEKNRQKYKFTPISIVTKKTEDSTPPEPLLEKAKKLADSGDLSDAESTCYQHINDFGDSSESYFILGLINESSKNIQIAEDFYRKSIYLNPNHYHSLLHLSLLLQQIGDNKSADLFLKRAQRIENLNGN